MSSTDKARRTYPMPVLDGAPLLVPVVLAALVLVAGRFRAIPENMIGGLGGLTITGLFVFAPLLEKLIHLPAPVLVIILSVLCKLTGIFPRTVEADAGAVYAIISRHFIYPTMIGLGMVYLPLNNVVRALSPGYVIACTAVVLAMVGTGFLVGRAIAMYPIDAALVTVCHSGLGGTGDVAILSAANRVNLMPFAQISTRLGGVTTVITAAWLIRLLG